MHIEPVLVLKHPPRPAAAVERPHFTFTKPIDSAVEVGVQSVKPLHFYFSTMNNCDVFIKIIYHYFVDDEKLKKKFQKFEEEVDVLEQQNTAAANPEVTKRNLAKFDGMCNNLTKEIISDMNKKFAESRQALEHMSPDQQEQFLTFFAGLSRVIRAAFAWLDRMLNKMIGMLSNGWQLAKETAKEVFDSIVDWFQNLNAASQQHHD